MKIVLLKNIDKLGEVGNVVNVTSGYARNYLLPRRQALPATESNIKMANREKQLSQARDNKVQAAATEIAEKIQALSCTITKQVGENDRLFGSVTATDIAKSLKAEGFEVDKKDILIESPIKALGIYDVSIKLHTNVKATLKLWVVAQD